MEKRSYQNGYGRAILMDLSKAFYAMDPIQDGPFWGWSLMGGANIASLLKICHIYPTIMKLGTIIPYPKKIRKINTSRDTPLEFC